MTPSIETAARSAVDPLPDMDAWMPDLDGIVPPQVAERTDGDPSLEAAASQVDGIPGPSDTRGNAASALVAGPGADGFAGARRLTGPAGATLVVDPELGVYYFESTRLLPLADLLSQPASAWTPVYSKSLAEMRDSSVAQPLARLLWFAGLVSSPGVLNPALDHQARFQLTRWAMIEREFPRHFRIAKQFLGRAATVDAAATAANVSLAEVVDYVNAGVASGRLNVTA